MKRAYSIPLIAIIALSLILPVLLMLPAPVVAARGNPPLAGVICPLEVGVTTCTDIVFANYNISVKAGEMVVSKIDGVSVTGYYFAIVFAINDTWIVSFDGSWFDLYMSKDGYSALSPDDIKYAGPFYVVDLATEGLKKRTFENPYLKGGKADYYIGKVLIGNTYYSLVIGPIPFDITAEYKYIKVYDGLASQVAVTRVTVEVLPSIALTPTWGPPGRMVTLTGVALRPNALLNLTYGPDNATHDLFAQVWTDAKGRFSYTWSIRDLKNAWTGTGTIPSDTVTVYVWYNATGVFIDSVTYTEYRRSFVEVRSLKKGHVALSFTDLYTGAGNDTVTVDAFVFDTIVLAGAWWNPRDSVKIYIGGVLVKEVYPNETHGFFNTTFTVPELPMGANRVDVYNAGVRYVFYINVLPTLVLIPEKGYIGDTVEVKGYGLPANSLVRIVWDVLCIDATLNYNVNIVNGTTGPDGKFNVTVTFKVPRAPGGKHVVSALVDETNVTYAYFTILPRIRLDPSTISADYGGLIKIIGEGLTPGVGYAVAVDNNFYGIVMCGPCGDAVAYAVGAGFRPGIHVVTLYAWGYVDTITYALLTVTCAGDPICTHVTIIRATVESIRDGVVYINTTLGTIKMTLDELRPMITEIRGGVVTLVTEIGVIKANLTTIRDLIASSRDAVITEIRGGVATIRTDLGTIRADLSSIGAVVVAIKGDTATIRTEIGTLRTDVATLAPTITDIKGDVATIKTEVGEIKGKVVSIEGNVATVVTDVGTIKASLGDVKTSLDAIKSGVDAIKSDVVAVKSDVATIKTDVAGVRDTVAVVRTGVDDVKSAVSPVPTLSTAIWLAVVFSLIAAILSAIVTISVRRKIAA
jgi:archaellum component FlaC